MLSGVSKSIDVDVVELSSSSKYPSSSKLFENSFSCLRIGESSSQLSSSLSSLFLLSSSLS